jgi:hypothetical protein
VGGGGEERVHKYTCLPSRTHMYRTRTQWGAQSAGSCGLAPVSNVYLPLSTDSKPIERVAPSLHTTPVHLTVIRRGKSRRPGGKNNAGAASSHTPHSRPYLRNTTLQRLEVP